MFRCCPQFINSTRLNSLWQQLKWLESHPEHANGGNHWIENLTALALGGLQFGGRDALAMHNSAMNLLQKELAFQVLADGGHEERSASYHLLILDRLVELACVLSAVHGECQSWLISSIESMTAWAKSVGIEGGLLPRFNDSAEDAAPPFFQVVSFADAYLQQRSDCSGLRRSLLQVAVKESKKSPLVSLNSPLSLPPIVTDLASTGWTILRPGHGWEMAFKCGVPCPPHLPGHVHSDQLSVDISYRGHWVICEAGTSIYGNGVERAYERSGAAHNVLQIGIPDRSGVIQWIDPVEVWSGFRAGRKAQPRDRHSGILSDDSCFASGSHDGLIASVSATPDVCS